MKEIKLKIYAVSLSACQVAEDLMDQTKGSLYYEHSPLFLISDSIQTASDQARIIAYNSWRKEEGWSMHSASILPMTEDFGGKFLGLVEQGLLAADSSESERFFRFDENAETDFDNTVSTDSH